MFVEVTWEKLIGDFVVPSPPFRKDRTSLGGKRSLSNNFSFKMFKIMRFLKSSECSKTIVGLTFTT